jgi:RNA polymerase sigma factor (sigma-70 family)
VANPNPKRSSLRLTKRQQVYFDAHLHLASGVAKRFCYKYPGVKMEEVLQAARLGLCVAVKRHLTSGKDLPFPPYAVQQMKWSCAGILFGRAAGNAAAKHARIHEVSADEKTCTKDGEQITRGERAENKLAKRELSATVADLNLQARRFEMRELISTLETLTSVERKILTLRYVQGVERDVVARKLKMSIPDLKRKLRNAVGKLRVHLADQGALAPGAPLPCLGDGG